MSTRRWYWPTLVARHGRWALHFAPTFVAVGVGYYPAVPDQRCAALSIGIWPVLVTFDANPSWYADAAERGRPS